jgi:vacuolar-type H+-ATPase subunit H
MMRKSKSKKLRDHAEDWAADLADRVGPRVETARDKAAPYLADARQKAGPVITEARDKARDKAGPAISDAKQRLATEVLPMIAAAVAAADEATEEVRTESKKRGKAAMAALKGDVEPPKKKHRMRKFLLVLGLGGLLAAVAKKLADRPATTTWQSSYTPTPGPEGGGAHRAEDEADDQGGSSPDVVAADNAAEPHATTTPDSPAETVDVSKK